MSKKITDENGNTYVQKKPFYKKVWFWLLIVVVILIAVSSANSSTPKKVGGSSETASTSKKAESQQTEFKVGETIELDGVKMTVNSVDYPENTEFNEAEDGKSWVVANVTIKNASKDSVSYNPFDFKLDADGNSTDFSAINTDVKQTLSSGDLKEGASVTGNLVGEADKSKTLKLEYRGNMFNDDAKFSVVLN